MTLKRQSVQISDQKTARTFCVIQERANIVQSFYGKKSVNLPLIATEGFSTVLDSAMYPY